MSNDYDNSKKIKDSSEENNYSIIIINNKATKGSNDQKTNNKRSINNKETNENNSGSFVNSSEFAEDIYETHNHNQDYNIDQLICMAHDEEKYKRYNDSLKIYNNILEKFPKENNIIIYRGKALCLAYINKINEALKFTENEIKTNFSEKEMLNIKSEIYFINKDYNNSLNNINKCLKINENDEDSLRTKIRTLYYMNRDKNDLLNTINKLKQINKFNPNVFYYLGRISQDEGKYNEAINLYLKSLENKFENIVEIYENLGVCYQINKEYKEALFYYEKYSIYIPKSEMYFNMGLCSIELKLFKKANEYFTMSNSLEANNKEALNYKGICYVNLNNEKKAERNFLKCIEIDNNFHKAYLNIIKLYISKRKYDNAENMIKKARNNCKKEPKNEEKNKYLNELKQFEILNEKEREEFEEKKNCSCQECNIL